MKAKTKILSLTLIIVLVIFTAPMTTFAGSSTQVTSDEHLNIMFTENDMKQILEQGESNYALLDYSDIAGITDITLQFNPSWFDASGKGILLKTKSIGGLYISDATLKEIENLKDNGNIVLTLKKGSINISIAQNGKIIDFYSFQNPMILFNPLNQQSDSDYLVMYHNRGTEEPKHLIPRSWYDNGIVYGQVNATGEYDIQDMGETEFNDTKGEWMDTAVKYLAARAVITGEEQGQFIPGKQITRAEFVSVLMNMFDIQLHGLWMPKPFNDQSDVPQWAGRDVLQATAMGIIKGDESYNFYPNANISRQDMFKITYTLIEQLGIIKESQGGMILREFNDSDGIADYAYMPLLALVQEGLIKGSQNALNPEQAATKAEMAQFLYNVLQFDKGIIEKNFRITQNTSETLQQEILPDAQYFASASGNVNEDKIPDTIYIRGAIKVDTHYIQDITLVVKDGKSGKLTDIPIKNNMGQNPSLFLADFNGDELDDIFISINSGGSGAFTYDYIYSFTHDKADMLFSSDLYNDTYKYDVSYKDGYKVEFYSRYNNASYSIDIGNRGEEYLAGIYDQNQKLRKPIDGFVNPVSSLIPMDMDNDGIYELLAFQKIAGQYNADSLGYVENFLKWEKDGFRLFNQHVSVEGIN